MDLVVRAPRFPDAGETILGGEFATFPGGKGANQAVAAARMGAKVSMVGRVGDDDYGRQLKHTLDAEGIDTTAVKTTPGIPTGVAVITVAEGGGNTIVVAPGANGAVTIEDVEAASRLIEEADVLLMQLEVPLEAVYAAAKIARRADRLVMLNTAPAMPLSDALHELVNVLIMNETELRVVGEGMFEHMPWLASFRGFPDSGDQSHRNFQTSGSGVVAESMVITFGEQGSMWMNQHGTTSIDAVAVTAVDTVGAGDAYCGALASRWPTTESGGSHRDRCLAALAAASAAGAIATTKRGAIPSLPTATDVQAMLDRSKQRTH